MNYPVAFEANEILPGLWLGSAADAGNLEALRARGIIGILNVADDVQDVFPGLFNYMRLDVRDGGQDTGISRVFPRALAFTREALKGGPLLVHCAWGINRSATIVTFLVMNLTGRTLLDSYNLVKSRRPRIFLLADNLRELQKYELATRGVITLKS